MAAMILSRWRVNSFGVLAPRASGPVTVVK